MTTESIARTYFEAWKNKDFKTLGSILADDVSFRGPLGTANGKQEGLAGLTGMSQIIDDIVVEKVFVDGSDVVTWFVLHTTVAKPAPTANWTHVEDGRITRIRVTFDASEFR